MRTMGRKQGMSRSQGSPWRFLTVEGKELPVDGMLGTHQGGEEKEDGSGKTVVSGTEN